MGTPLLFVGEWAEIAAREEAARALGLGSFPQAHPDLMVLAPSGGGTIGIEAVREAIAWVRYRPLMAPAKVVLIGPAERLTHEAASALLKSLEEAPEYTRYVLFASSADRVLPTVRSRCRPVRPRIGRSWWEGKLAELGYGPEERAYLLGFLDLDPAALEGFLSERRHPLEEERSAREEMEGLPPGELIARFIAYSRDPIRRRVAASLFLERIHEVTVAELFSAAERLSRAGREASSRFLAEYLGFLYSAGKATGDLARKVSLAKGEIEANANTRLLLETVLLGWKWERPR